MTSLFSNVPVNLVIDDIANNLISSDVALELPFLHFKNTITGTQTIIKIPLNLSSVAGFIHNGKLFV